MKRFCFTELCKKEVICVNDGKKIGYPSDAEIDKCGNIINLIVPCKNAFVLFSGKTCIKVPWCDVERVGCDVIWVRGKEYSYEGYNKSNKCCDK